MNYENLTKEELIHELSNLKQCVIEFEKSEAELKEAETALRQTEEKYRNIFENASEGIFQTSIDGRFISANPSLAHIHGYDSPQDLIHSITDMAHQLYVDPENRLELAGILNRYGGAQNFEVQMYRKDRSLHWISINVKAVKDKNGKTLYYEGTMQDITQRKTAEKALMESEERYRTAIEHSNDGVAILRGNINEYVNRRFVEMFEYEKYEDIIGKPITKIVHPDDLEMVTNINKKRQNSEPVPSSYEFKGITKNGKSIYIEVSATSTTFRGKPVYLAYLRDITERKIAHNALIKSHKELENLNRAKTKAVNHISHEIKTPLAVIQGNIRILKRKLQGMSLITNFQGLIEPLERNLERLFNLSKETDEIFNVSQELEALVILDDLDRLWSRMEVLSDTSPDIRSHWEALKTWNSQYLSGSTQNFHSIDMLPFVRSVLEKIMHLSSHRGLRFQTDGENFLFVSMDPVILRDIVESLVKNSIENTPDGGIITITMEQKEDKIWLHVADYGIGITEENQQYIFDGLFHTEETESYSSKKPYDFGAGGKGLELLRMKINGRRFGFDISCKSNRCIYLPDVHDICPGDISMCMHCKSPDDCKASGGTTFSVSFPIGTD